MSQSEDHIHIYIPPPNALSLEALILSKLSKLQPIKIPTRQNSASDHTLNNLMQTDSTITITYKVKSFSDFEVIGTADNYTAHQYEIIPVEVKI